MEALTLACKSTAAASHHWSEQTKHKAELQHLRMQINRLRRMGEDTQDLLLKLRDKEKSYGRRKQQRPPGAYLATHHTDTNE